MSSSPALARGTSRNGYRSWGETQIARMFERYGVPFTYEQPAAVVDRERTRIWYPDFHLRGLGIFLEYRGREHDPVYDEGMVRKEAVYAANGLTVLTMTPDVFRGNWPAMILNRIEGTLADRLGSFRAVRRQSAVNYRFGWRHGCERPSPY